MVMFASAVTVLMAISARAQAPDASLLWIHVDDRLGDGPTMYFGNATNATYCIDDGTGGTTNYYESISPPDPPPPTWSIRWKGVRTTSGNACIVDGLFPRDYRPLPLAGNLLRRDTFKLAFGYILNPDDSCDLTWPDPTYLAARCDSMFFTYIDKSDFSLHKIDMFAQSSCVIPNPTLDDAPLPITIYKFGKANMLIDGVGEKPEARVKEFSLKPNYPNPFNPSTNLAFDIPKNSTVDVSIFNVLGQKIATLVTGQVAAGAHTAVWNGTTQNGSPVTSGVYFARMTARAEGTGEVFTALRKLLLMK
jgi:hypothetical protein